jgi:LPPG:FO 2-phospho-L-lactate transferase
MISNLKIVVLAGGVGGSKLAVGFSKVVIPENLTTIVNIGDDFEYCGLRISPDLDTVCYALSGLANPETGWGQRDESWNCYSALDRLGSPNWFRLGDRDLATHLERTRLINEGKTITEITSIFCNKFGIKSKVVPVTNDLVPTIITTKEYGELSFQEYFVKYQFAPTFIGLNYRGIEKARPADEVFQALKTSDLLVIAPSNPWLSIFPILDIPGVREEIKSKFVICVSPIVGNKALKGPAAKIFMELGIEPNAYEIGKLYKDLARILVIDKQNEFEKEKIQAFGIIPLVTDTIMVDEVRGAELADNIIKQFRLVNKG